VLATTTKKKTIEKTFKRKTIEKTFLPILGISRESDEGVIV
jgi:hypothetical protein